VQVLFKILFLIPLPEYQVLDDEEENERVVSNIPGVDML
jgi:hypothetical protein